MKRGEEKQDCIGQEGVDDGWKWKEGRGLDTTVSTVLWGSQVPVCRGNDPRGSGIGRGGGVDGGWK